MPASGDTLLRQVRAAELARHASPQVVGIDDWAWRRGLAPALGMSALVAYRWLKAGGPPAHHKPAQPRQLDSYVPYLEAR